jgi:anti-sigma factor RsiW
MNASELPELLAAYADDALDAPARAAVEAHLAAHPEDRAVVERWQALRQATTRVLHATPTPAGLADRVRANLRREPRPRRSLHLRLARWAPGVAAAAVLIGAVVLWPRGAAATSIDPDDFAQIYQRCALRNGHDAFQLAGSLPNDLAARIGDKAPFRCELPCAAPAGFEVAGACACSPERGVRTMHIFFRAVDNPERVISVFATERPVSLRGRSHSCAKCAGGCRAYEGTQCAGGSALVTWCDQRHRYVVVGAASQKDLIQIADHLQVTPPSPTTHGCGR